MRYATPRPKRIRRVCGITPALYEQLLEAQNKICAICGTTKPGGRWGTFVADHDHQTGKFRGLLCLKCNTALTRLEADPSWGEKALKYLMSATKTVIYQ